MNYYFLTHILNRRSKKSKYFLFETELINCIPGLRDIETKLSGDQQFIQFITRLAKQILHYCDQNWQLNNVCTYNIISFDQLGNIYSLAKITLT